MANEGRERLSSESRCSASCEVLPGVLKRCIRAIHHAEDHLWVEALNRSDGHPRLVTWTGPDAREPTVVATIHIGSSSDRQ